MRFVLLICCLLSACGVVTEQSLDEKSVADNCVFLKLLAQVSCVNVA